MMRKKMLSFLTQQTNTVKADDEPKSEAAGMLGKAFRAALSKKLDKFVATDRPKAPWADEVEQ